MNESRELTASTHSSNTPDTSSCNLVSIIPNLGMSSCRGRAEAFARSLSSKLRTLGSQNDDDCEVGVSEEQAIINGGISDTTAGIDEVDEAVGISKTLNNTWLCHKTGFEHSTLNVTDRQPLRHDTESFFDFDCELESPGSPADECEYLRLIETASNTPHNSVGESGYACTSTPSSSSSADGTFYDIVNTEDDSQLNDTLTNNQHEIVANTEQNDDNELKEALETTVIEKKETKYELTDKLAAAVVVVVNGHLAKDVTLSNVKLENELTEKTNNELNIADKADLKEIQNEQIVEIIKAEEIVDIKTEAIKLEKDEQEIEKEQEKEKIVKEKNNFTHSGLDTTDDEDECRPQRVRRCSSLKTGKTPPGTPGRKKIVRFADKLGLDLADIKTFLDEIPNIPKSAFEDLEINDIETAPILFGPKSDKLLVPLFQQPGGLPTFLDLVRERQVSLENAAVTDHINQTITGSVRVRNLDFHKSVHIRYTLDHWRSYADLQANYVENSCDGFSDKFSFILFGNSMQVGQRLEFAVRFQCKGQQFWDNNYGINYCFQCLPANNIQHNATFITTTTNNTIATTTTTTTTTTTITNNHNNNNRINIQNYNNSNTNNNNNNNNNNNKSTLKQNNHNNNSNHLGKPHNGLEQEHADSQVLRLLSPTAGEAWCASFY